ncbi:MAG: hypothetical protein AAFX44_20255 [Pseudomonadota bacterium]
MRFLCLSVLCCTAAMAACSGDQSDPVATWVSARQAELPVQVGAFEWRELTVYENQVIATYVPSDPSLSVTGTLSDTRAFELVTEAVCQVTGVDTVWESRYEHYASVTSSSGDTLQTIRTKSFDCCVFEASQRMSQQAAQNSCPYSDY